MRYDMLDGGPWALLLLVRLISFFRSLTFSSSHKSLKNSWIQDVIQTMHVEHLFLTQGVPKYII